MSSWSEIESDGHDHVDSRGYIHRCYHKCRGLLSNWQFWAGMTLGFPFEHFLYEKVWPFTLITGWLGL